MAMYVCSATCSVGVGSSVLQVNRMAMYVCSATCSVGVGSSVLQVNRMAMYVCSATCSVGGWEQCATGEPHGNVLYTACMVHHAVNNIQCVHHSVNTGAAYIMLLKFKNSVLNIPKKTSLVIFLWSHTLMVREVR